MIRRIIGRTKKTTAEWWLNTGAPGVADRRAFRAAPAPTADRRVHVLVAPPGGGNIGDQALVEAFLENTTGPVRVIVRRAADLVVPAEQAERIEVVELPALLYRVDAAHRRDIVRLRALLTDAVSFTVVGADIMDGRYSPRGSVNRSNVAELAAIAGVDSRILGFSWNGAARPAARRALVRASRAGVRVLLRDPLSAERARRDHVQHVQEVADIVFAAHTVQPGIVHEVLPAGAGQPFAIVNVSGLVAKKVGQLDEYARVIEHLRAKDIPIVLLPHVIRPGADDLDACRALLGAVGSRGITLVERVLRPAEVRGLCAGASFVVTGRMHLAIMAMMNGKPAVTLSTQGKVEGLMRLLGVPQLSVEPTPGFGSRIVDLIDEVRPDDSPARAAIAEHLPHLVDLARRNLDGLPVTTAGRV
ncbi:polysaccharide pyruvyl transferase WcaK-like protein [Diaminobutyricimonas aerilata]|uniref:Polysaccharide pyruvyl transferase WcaK-like protein n=1 Tax=Diaminobutyricimonas aerilata TaxID=1162967 RepID=A0A2M9CIW9_9MICO|nr:polysaccharide pyruvyl transferase family protein [Diaminobutyricimonas aerilata]PJJ71853.1 polysaccharide pyruvyl transferase WcaK-like protein [Diaminobutyricimonas aerilata]